jgi:hypothetical protein
MLIKKYYLLFHHKLLNYTGKDDLNELISIYKK